MGRIATIISGVAIIVAGALLGVGAYVTPALSGGVTYVLAYGAVVFGIFRAFRGLLMRGEAAAAAAEAEDNEQAWSLGEALGKGLSAIPRAGKLALLVLAPLSLAAATGGAAGWLALQTAVSPSLIAAPKNLTLIAAQAAGRVGPGVGLFVWLLVMPMMAKGALSAVRGEPVKLTPSLRYVPRLFLFALIQLFLVAVSLPVAAIPALPLVLTPFFVVDQDLGLVESMRRSWEFGARHFGKLFALHVAIGPLFLVGDVTVVGTLVTLPFYFATLAYAYVRVTARSELPWYPPSFASKSIRAFLMITLGALSVMFVGLDLWVRSLPTLRGSAWSIKDTAIRASTIVTGVFAVVVLLALLLPYFLDRLEGRRFTSFVAARHVRSQKSGFLTVISVLSICGVAISSCALSSVVSVMGGFSQDLKRKILGNNAHIVIDVQAGTPFADYDATLARVRAIPRVVGATPVVHGEVMASSASNLAGVVVSGIEPSSIGRVIELGQNLEVGKVDYLEHPEKLTRLPPNEVIGIGPGGEQYFRGAELPGLPDDIDPAVKAVIINKPDRPGIILGRELAKTLHVYVGDEVTLVSPLGDLGPMGVMPRTRRFRVAAIFYSGMYEYDASYVYTMLDVAQDYFQTAGRISAIEIKVEDAEHSDRTADQVLAAVARPELRVRDWHEINKNLFSALKLERFATFIILSIAIMVASFCIVCTLLLMVTEKGKEIAILKAVGASDGMILRTFMIEGMIIGGIGTVFGVVTGLAVCTGLSWFGLRLDPEVYYIDRLPITVNGWDFLTVALAALTICTLSTVYPAYAASKLRPVDGLRNE
jgi:lipoprotein-releasing system permease protein